MKPTKRIEVVSAPKGKFKVMVDFVQRGILYSSPCQANQEAEDLSKKVMNSTLHLFEIKLDSQD